MTDENIQNLLGGFATGTLTDQERNLLFTAALKDQELFNALADEEVLREFLSDPASRRRVVELLQPHEPGIVERITSWMRRPATWVVAGGAVAALVVAIVIRDSHPPAVEMARTTVQSLPAQQPAERARDEAKALERRDAPALAFKREASAAPKMKVAVLEFDSGPVPAKEADSKSADLGKTTSDLLGKKLDLEGYAVIDRQQVVKAMQAQKLNERQLTPAAAAGVGRSLGADAVILGTVKPSLAMNLNDAPAASGARQEMQQSNRAKTAATEQVEVTATAIDTQNAVSLAYAQNAQSQLGGLQSAVDQVALSLGQQIQQNARVRIEGLVTDVNAKVLTLNVGSRLGVKVGDRLEVRRAGKPIGRVVINSVQDSLSVGLFEGPEQVKTGDVVASY